MPAILKGYVDRVFSYGFAWEMRGETIEGKLRAQGDDRHQLGGTHELS